MTDSSADTTPLGRLWLSHHYACDADRCVHLGDTPVCRRCLAIFIGFVPAVIALSLGLRDDLQAGDLGLVLALTIVAAIDFVQVVRRVTPYSARRVLVLSPAIGAVFAWMAVSGVQDGLGVVHGAFVAGVAGLLGVLFVNGQVVRRGSVAEAS